MEKLNPGDDAPQFELPSEDGKASLADFRGEWLVLYFYPKDFTSGCTREACDFRDALSSKLMDATVVGVSPDEVETHRSFRQEHGLPFTLLSDSDFTVAKSYGAYGNKGAFGVGVKRSTFIIDPEGRVARSYYNVKSADHAAKVAEDLKALQA